MKELVILGAGTAGTMIANRMARAVPDGWRVTVVDGERRHVYQPGLLFVPFGDADPSRLVRQRGGTLDPAVRWVAARVDRIDPATKTVALADGERLAWDLLVVATGSRIRPEATPGLLGPAWHGDVGEFYTLEGAQALAARLERLEKGRLVVNVVDMPIKCPVAPLEFAFLADAWARKLGRRRDLEIVFATPLDGAFTKPRASALLGDMLGKRGISVVPQFAASEVVDGRVLRAYDGRELPFDVLVSVPLHGGAQAILDSGLGDVAGFVPTDRHTLRSAAFEDVFVVGDATDVPTSKAGAVAHFQGEVVVPNLLRWIAGRPPLADYDGHANCFVETGDGKAMLLDFNYTTEPLPGRFPLAGVGPFRLLEESPVNHWGKLSFEWIYWNVLVRGGELPFDHRMALAGKWER